MKVVYLNIFHTIKMATRYFNFTDMNINVEIHLLNFVNRFQF